MPTPTGKVALTVPAGTQSGSSRLRGMGMPSSEAARRTRRSMARARIAPTSPSDRERELYEELRRIRQERSS